MLWSPYHQQEHSYDYAFHPQMAGQWYPDQGYGQIQGSSMAMDVQGTAQYPAYNHVPPTHSPYASPQGDGIHGGMPTAELESSWRNLFAQFNQS